MERKTPLHITRRTFVKGVGLVAVGTGLGLSACAAPSGQGGSAASSASSATSQASSSASASSSSVAASTSSASSSAAGQTKPLLAIIHTNDTHGHDVEVPATDNTAGNFYMAAVPALKAEWEANGYEVLVVDVGDATQGTPLVDQSLGEAGITFLNACEYDVMALGNHEFDRGPEQLDAYVKLAEFPMLSANVLDAQTGEMRFQPNTLVELKSGTKVGLFGLTTPETMTTSRPTMVESFRFLGGDDLYACAQQQVDELREQGADLVVCLGHLGNSEVCKPSTSTDVLNNVDGIDLFLDAHDHKFYEEEVNGTLLVETGCYMNNIGLVVIDEGTPTNNNVAYGDFDGVETSAKSVIDTVDAQVGEELAVALGHTSFFLDGNRNPGLRTQETNLGDLCTDAFIWAAGESMGTPPDGAIINGGGIRASFEEGDITLGNIKTVFAFSNQIYVLTVTGAQLLETLEAGYQSVGVDALGAFPQLAGIEVTLDTTVPYEMGELYPNSTYYAPAKPGSRVTIHSVGGKEWSADASYTIATSDFLAQGGDTYYAFKQAADAQAPVVCDFDYEALSGYLTVACDHEVPERYAQSQGRIKIL